MDVLDLAFDAGFVVVFALGLRGQTRIARSTAVSVDDYVPPFFRKIAWGTALLGVIQMVAGGVLGRIYPSVLAVIALAIGGLRVAGRTPARQYLRRLWPENAAKLDAQAAADYAEKVAAMHAGEGAR